ncbi:luciferin 4-monooxygenase isoform X1 [Anabrus simplex]|uniref:luciferin 4-monooxygenase isoform X1 n=1 Tax=Anabrus simplex TaxID=316456 RepID=UPI0035A2D03C
MDCEENVIFGECQNWTPPDQPLGRYLLTQLKIHGDKIIQVYPQVSERLSAVALADRALHYAGALQSLGVQPGDRVVVCCNYLPHFSAIVLATICCGATCAPLNFKFDSGDLGRLLQVIKPKVIFTVPETLKELQIALHQQATAPTLIVFGEGETWQRFESAGNQNSFKEPVLSNVLTTTAVILCSSGTTGLPKGVCITHANWFAALHTLKYKDSQVQPDDIMVLTSPPYWVTGVLYSFSSMEQGMCMVFEFGSSEERVLTSIQEHKATLLLTASNFLLSIAKHPSLDDYMLSSLTGLICGGGAMPADSELFVKNRFRVPVIQAYGMTECLIISGAIYKGQRKLGSVGTLTPTLKMKVVDIDTGLALDRNKPGEFVVKGPLASPGYLDNPEATATLFQTDGWTHTGDIGYVDDDGNIFVIGRIKDIIKYRGDHVSPVELESILISHPDVLEAAVIGVPHPTDQEHPRAYVVRRPGTTITADHLIHLVESRVAQHKHLRGGVQFLDALPKSATGKISRIQLRHQLITEA